LLDCAVRRVAFGNVLLTNTGCTPNSALNNSLSHTLVNQSNTSATEWDESNLFQGEVSVEILVSSIRKPKLIQGRLERTESNLMHF